MTKNSPIPARLLLNPLHLLSLGFGSGLSPLAPGTMGTLVAVPIYLLLMTAGYPVYLLALIIFTLLGFYLCGYTARALGVHDHGGIVWDEIVGYMITMLFVPMEWSWIVLGFIFFRLFDIWKPWPIRLLDKNVHGGVGIMVDDILAGIYAAICLQLIDTFIL
ncbi:MAG: phosphatidylglycerophosphatase A [Gammaproteobacteria bacterium]|nr:phosphatidylglycerophosphatase A [Gammaproteobacteria bacterium]